MSPHYLATYSRQAKALGDIMVVPKHTVMSLGALFDGQFTMEGQVSNVVRTCNYHLRQLGKIQKNITMGTCHVAVQALIVLHLDYCSVLLAGLLGYQIWRLHDAMNRAGRVITHAHKRLPKSWLLWNLHWLPMVHRIKFKVLVYTSNAAYGITPSYVRAPEQVRVPGCPLCSSTGPPRLEPPKRHKRTRHTSFSMVVSYLCDELPVNLRAIDSLHVFKRHLQVVLFLDHYG